MHPSGYLRPDGSALGARARSRVATVAARMSERVCTMSQLSDTQLVILSAAVQRDDRTILPLPERLKGGAAAKVVNSLIGKGLVEEVDARHGDLIWRDTGDGHGVTLVATDAAFSALGISADLRPAQAGLVAVAVDDGEMVDGAPADQGIVAAMVDDRARKSDAAPRQRAASKQAKLIEMLKRPDGATIPEVVEALGWQPHTVRGAIAGALKKKLGINVNSEKIDDRGRVYRVVE